MSGLPIFRRTAVLALALFTTMGLAACGDDSTGPGDVDLSGTYQLVSITFQGQPQLEPPVAEGTFTLTQTTYDVSIDINVPPPNDVQIRDQGTYDIDGNSWSQESSVDGRQTVGTFTLEDGRLTVNATTQGQIVITVWDRTS